MWWIPLFRPQDRMKRTEIFVRKRMFVGVKEANRKYRVYGEPLTLTSRKRLALDVQKGLKSTAEPARQYKFTQPKSLLERSGDSMTLKSFLRELPNNSRRPPHSSR